MPGVSRRTPLSEASDGGLRSDQFLWEGAVEGVAQEGEFVDKEGELAARGMISWNGYNVTIR